MHSSSGCESSHQRDGGPPGGGGSRWGAHKLGVHRALAIPAALGVLLLIAACGDSPAADPGENGNNDSIAGDPGSLVVYSGRSETLVDPIINQFADATGIDVRINYAGTSELAATLLEEGENSPADVFYAQDPGGLGAVQDMLRPLDQQNLSRVPDWARSPEDDWVGVSGRARVIIYNTDRVDESELPDDIWGFVEPEWEGRIGWAPTNGSFQTMVTGMRAVWGEDETREWLEGIVANNPRVYPNNTTTVEAAGRGEIDVGFVNHYYLYRFLAEHGEGFAARNYHTKGGGPDALIMVSGAGILSTAENEENAEKFIDFLLSTVAQQYFASQTFEYPLVEGVQTDRLLTPVEEIDAPAISMRDMADLEGTVRLLEDVGALR